jgi:hypothetical protein
MTTDRDFERTAMAWLADGPEELHDRVVDAVVDEIHVTPQRHALRLSWRFPSMTTPARIAAAAVVGVLAIGGALYVLAPGVSGPGGPGPTVSPTPSPSPVALLDGLRLRAGTYVVKPFDDVDGIDDGDLGVCYGQPGCTEDPADDTIRISFTVPDGWAGAPRHSIWTTDQANNGAWVTFERGASLYAEPCGDQAPPDIPVGPTVDDFANALVAHPILDVTTPVDVTLDGYVGKSMTLQVPDDISACPGSYWPWEPGFYAQGPGQRWHLWILDVDGVRVLIRGMDFASTSAQHQAELQAIVESIQIQP